MRRYKWAVVAGLAIVGSGVLAAAATQSTQAAHLNIKLGLWEMTTKPQVTGDLSGMISPEQMQKMSPEDRARMQAAMQQMQASMQKTRLTKECMTQEKLAKGFDTGNDDSHCKSTVTTNTASDYEAHLQCPAKDRDGPHSVDVHFTALSSDHVTGKVHSDMSQNGKSMSFDAAVEGRWLGADCGSVKDSEEESSH